MKTTLITGMNSRDGAYLAEFRREKICAAHGISRWVSFVSATSTSP